jgi:dTDP-4-dehydrorhamnose reductase
LSTDYVFDGAKRTPYAPDDPVNPINVYGASKEAGETAVREALREHIILRLAWVYDETGRNFVTTMLSFAENRPELRIVTDQTGTPTYAFDAAQAIDHIATATLSAAKYWGTYHLTSKGQTNWFAFAEAIFSHARRDRPTPKLIPITTREFAAPAQRPLYSVLDTNLTSQHFAISMPDWRDGLVRCIAAADASNTVPIQGHLK